MVRKYLLILSITLGANLVFAQADFRIAGTLCLDHSLQFLNESGVTADSVLWDFDDGSSSTLNNPIHSYDQVNDFNPQLTIYFNGTSDQTSQSIQIGSLPSAEFSIDTLPYSSFTRLFSNASESLESISEFHWNFGDGSDTLMTNLDTTTYKYQQVGAYRVWFKVIDTNGCSDTISHEVSIHNIFRVPNVFTPNGDNKNDQFIVSSNGVDLFEIYIYSRWGSLVFERKGHQQIVWDGRMPNGTLVKPGTYYYVITVLDSDTAYMPENGFISIFY